MTNDKPDLKDVLARTRSPAGGDSAAHGRTPPGPRWETLDLLFNSNPQPMWIYERVTLRFLAVNEAAIDKYGYTAEEFLQMTLADIRPPEDVSRLREVTSGHAVLGYNVSSGWRHRTRSGATIYVNIHSHDVDYHGREAVLVMAADVTELFNTIDALKTQRAYYTQLFENSPEGIVLLDGNGVIVEANSAFQKMFGYSIEELVGHTPLSLIVPPAGVKDSMSAFAANVDENRSSRLTSVRQKKTGELINVEVLAYPVHVNGESQGVFAIYQDITEKNRALSEIEFQARHDALTGLPNRAHLESAMQLLLNADSHARDHAFLYIDLDQFKVINDTGGHSVGDKALVEVGTLLKSSVRESDLVARLGGDEFGVLLAECDEENALRRAESLLSKISAYRFSWEGRSFALGASIGAVEIRDRTLTVENILSAADAACYAAKDSGRNRVRIYKPHDEYIASRKSEMNWVAKLREALEEDRFELFFQEMEGLNETTRNLRHTEILLRYRDEDGSLVLPGSFVPAAERYNLMPAIDRWVLNAVCRRMSCDRRDRDKETVCINLSGTTLSDERFVDYVQEVLSSSGVPARSLCFEITETAAISNLEAAKRLIADLKVLGCSIALDDFGCGMSSFNYLRTLSVDYLKIDGTFIRDIHRNRVDCAMTEAIHHLGKILGLKTIAEFVENREIRDKLREIGVDYAQGYAVHRPERWDDR